jgi:phosphatidylinositol glycan class A protein
VRYLPSGLKVYHVPFEVIARQDTLPQFFGLFPQLRSILVRERIDIVHGHQALSSMAHEGILHARTMGLRAVFTDHSLFGFADAASILTNKLLRFVLSDVDGVCCVSHVGYVRSVRQARGTSLIASLLQQGEHDAARCARSTQGLRDPKRRRACPVPTRPSSSLSRQT